MLKPGDIVTDMEEGSCYQGKQGEVWKVQMRLWGDAEVTVRFDRELYLYHLREDQFLNGIYEIYPPGLLRKDDDWEPEVYARRLFGRLCHHIEAIRQPLNPAALCLVEGCQAFQQKTIWINVWGTACNVHVCLEHAQRYHGKFGEVFPWRKEVRA